MLERPIDLIRPGDVVWIPPGEKALALRNADHSQEQYCDSGTNGPQDGQLDGKRSAKNNTTFRKRCGISP